MTQPNPQEILRSRGYVALLVVAGAVGVPISAAAYGFLALVGALQSWLFTDLPKAIGLHGEPLWWPIPILARSNRPRPEEMHSWRTKRTNNRKEARRGRRLDGVRGC